MTEPQVTMIACPDCGMPIRASREHECDPAKAIASLRSRCEELEKERDKALTRCEELQSLLDVSMDGNQELWWRERQERDEARQWAAKLYKENADLEATLALCRSAGHEISDIGFDALAENTSLRAQLAEARTKAFAQAIGIAGRLYPHPSAAQLAIIQNIRALKDNADAYPADEISTVGDGS